MVISACVQLGVAIWSAHLGPALAALHRDVLDKRSQLCLLLGHMATQAGSLEEEAEVGLGGGRQ